MSDEDKYFWFVMIGTILMCILASAGHWPWLAGWGILMLKPETKRP